MNDQPSEADGQSLIVKQLIAEFKNRTDSGEQLSVKAFIAEHPEHTAELKRHFENRNKPDAPKQTGKKKAEEANAGASDAGKLSTEDATAQTIVAGSSDSDTSVTMDFRENNNSSTNIEISTTFSRYAIQKVLGQGAMGAVYLAKDTQLDRDVALKIPKFGDGNGVDDEELLARFYREARASATLRNPNICPVYDVGEIDGQHYITMAFIEGRPLKDYTQSKKAHSEKQIITTIRKLATGLAEAHEIGVIHRDLKPANIMVDMKGEPVVMDFGLARRSSSDDVQVTQSGAILGTPAYMAPEQVAGDQTAIDHQVDIYALGVIMYELITGEMPFKGNLMALLQQIAINKPTKPSELRPDIDPRLETICLKMIAGEQKQRYQSMTEVANDLQEVLRNPDKSDKKEQSKKKGPKPTSLPSAKEESNPALISIDQPKSYAEELREKKGKRSKRPKSTSKAKSKSTKTAQPGSKSSGPPKNLLIAGGIGGLLLLLVIIFFMRDGKHDDVQITRDVPVIPQSENSEKPTTPIITKSNSETPGTSETKNKYALQFDGTSKVSIPKTTWSERDELTYELFVKAVGENQKGNKVQYLVNQTFTAALERAENWIFVVNSGSEGKTKVSNSKADLPVELDRWVHLAGVIKNRKLQLFVDGVPAKAVQLPNNVNTIQGATVILGGNFTGSMKGVKISKVALYEKAFTPPKKFSRESSTLALYNFDEGAGNVLKDSSGNGYDGIIKGAKWVKDDGGSNNDARVGPNLLDQVNLDKDVIKGTWKRDGGSVLHPKRVQGSMSLLQLPKVDLPNEYDVEIILERSVDGRGGANLVFGWFGYQAAIAIDGLPQGGWFIERIDGKSAKKSPAYVEGFPLKTGVRHRVRFAVRKDRLEAYLDDKLAIQWVGDPKCLSPFPWLKTADVDRLSLGANSAMRFHSVMVRDVATDRYLAPESIAASPPPTAIAPFDTAQAKAHQKAWADYLKLPVEDEVKLPGGEKMKFVLAPPGEFMMGSSVEEIELLLADDLTKLLKDRLPYEKPRHRVNVNKPFLVSKYEVTRGNFRAFVEATNYKTLAEVDGRGGAHGMNGPFVSSTDYLWNTEYGLQQTDAHPVVQVSWVDAVAYCDWISSVHGVKCRLLSEEEWEYTCRAGTETRWSTGDNPERLTKAAWLKSNGMNKTHPVGELLPNAWGLHDMHGNVFEWCADTYRQDAYTQTTQPEAREPHNGDRKKVLRGGSFKNSTVQLRSAYRGGSPAGERQWLFGFRVAIEVENAKNSPK